MNIMIKTALSVAAFTAFMGIAHADGDDKKPVPQGCTELCKSAAIPIQLTVPKICDLKLGVSSITLDSTGKGSGTFKVGANAPYQLLVYTDNQTSGINTSVLKNGNNTIATSVTTSGPDNLTLGTLKSEDMTLNNLSTYTVNVATTESFGINKPAGVYKDTYHIQVYF